MNLSNIDYSTLTTKELLELYVEYKEKAKLYDTKQMAAKIALNSAYGACGNRFFKYYSLENASAVTVTGQIIIQTAAAAVNKYLNRILKTNDVDYVCYIDTDSLYIRLDTLVDKMFPTDQSDINKITNFIDKFVNEKIEHEIDNALEQFRLKLNHRQNNISFKRESIADKAIFKSKKRYFMNVIDNEGVRYNTPELKIMGIEIVRSSTPRFCKRELKKALLIILEGTNKDLKDFIRQCRKDFKLSPFEDISFPRGVSNIDKFTNEDDVHIKGTPLHVRGAACYNKLIKQHNLSYRPLITNGSKTKYIYIREPNHIRSNVISFIDDIPQEFDITRYIDYRTQFDKSFIDPLKSITDIIGWNINTDGLTFT